jgi:hypothetical protein
MAAGLSNTKPSATLFQLLKQLLFQPLSRRFLDRPAFGRNSLLVGPALAAAALVDLAWQM